MSASTSGCGCGGAGASVAAGADPFAGMMEGGSEDPFAALDAQAAAGEAMFMEGSRTEADLALAELEIGQLLDAPEDPLAGVPPEVGTLDLPTLLAFLRANPGLKITLGY